MNQTAKVLIIILMSVLLLVSCIQKNPGPNNPPTIPQKIYPAQSELLFENTFNAQWTASEDPEGQVVTYAIKFARSLEELKAGLFQNEQQNTTFQMTNLEAGTWFWQVRATDPEGNKVTSPIWDFTVNGDGLPQPENPGAVPPDPSLIVTNIQATSFTLDWEPYQDPEDPANPITYRVDLYEEGAESPIRTLEKGYYQYGRAASQSGQTTNTFYTFSGLTDDTLYYWIILALNNASQTTVVGSSRVKTGNQPPSVPELLNPEQETEAVALTDTLEWTQSIDPDGDSLLYYVFLDTFKNSPRIVTPQGLSEILYNPELMEGKTYYWRILVKDGNGGAAISPLGTFSTVDPNGLNYPTAPTPADNAQDTDSSTYTTLVWEHEGTGDYHYSVWFGSHPKNMTAVVQEINEKTHTIQTYPKGNTWYFWQVKVTDTVSGESVTGPQWQFKTSAKLPPVQIGAQTTESGDQIELVYDKPMADPVGQHTQYTVQRELSQNARDREIIQTQAIALKAGSNKRFLLTLEEAVDAGDQITISYAKGNVQAVDGAYLESYDATQVTNSTQAMSPVCLEAVITEEGKTIELIFNKSMAVPEPTAHEQFSVTVNGTVVPVNSALLKSGVPEIIVLTLGIPIGKNNPINLGYTRGTVTSSDSGELASFQNKPVDRTQLDVLRVMKDITWNYSTIQDAINAAENGDILIISEGTYNETVDLLDKDLHIQGTDPDDPVTVANTVIDAQEQGTNTVTIDGNQTANTIIEGLTITGGAIDPDISSQRISIQTISGIYIKESDPVIRKNIIAGNGSGTTHTGRGVYVESAGPKIYDNIISNNTTLDYGGGILVYSPVSPTAPRPVAPATQPWIYANTIENNTANKGGGIYIEAGTTVYNSSGEAWRRFNSPAASVDFTENTALDNNTYNNNTEDARPVGSDIIFQAQTTSEGVLTLNPREYEGHQPMSLDVHYAFDMALFGASLTIDVPTGFTITGNAFVIIDTNEFPADEYDFSAQTIEITPITTTDKATVTLRLEETSAPTGTGARGFMSRDIDYPFTAKADADGTDTAWSVSDTSSATFTAIVFSTNTNIRLKEVVDYLSITDAPTKVYYLPDTTVASLTSMLEAPDGSPQSYSVKTAGGNLNPQDNLPGEATLTVLAEDGTTEHDYSIYSASIKLAVETGGNSIHSTLQEAVDAADTVNANLITICTDTISEGTEVVIDSGKEITIQSEAGDRAITVIDGASSHRLFNISGGASVTFKDLEMRNGKPNNGTDGGAVQANGVESLTFKNCHVHTNEASSGGGLFVKDTATVTIENSVFEQNSVNELSISGGGGGVYANSVEKLTVEQCVFDQNNVNAAGGAGGAIYWLPDHELIIANSTITNNSSDDDGGAIYSRYGNTLISNTLISSNTAGGSGGAVLADNDAIVEINSSHIESNTASSGGGLFIKGSLLLIDSTVASNTTTEVEGGGIFIDGGNAEIYDSVIRSNTAPSSGGGVCMINSVSTITNTEITQNSASNGGGGFEGGGGVMVFNSLFSTYDSTYTLNETSESGGGIYLEYMDLGGYQTVADIQRSSINDNTAEKSGAGIYATNCTITIEDSEINKNESNTNGGGIAIGGEEPTVDISNSYINNNSSGLEGGGIYAYSEDVGGSLEIDSSTIQGNSSQNGGAIYLSYIVVSVTNTIVSDNSASFSGGGIGVFGSLMDTLFTTYNSTYTSNEASQDGGGIYASAEEFLSPFLRTTVDIQSCFISDNIADFNGGGICLKALNVDTVATLTSNDILSNIAEKGAGIYIKEDQDNNFTGTIYGNDIKDNAVNSAGGGIYLFNTPAVFNADGDAWLEFDCPASDTADVEGNDTPANNNNYSGNTVNASDTATGAHIEFES